MDLEINFLPKIKHKGVVYIFDVKLSELRTDTRPINFIRLDHNQAELLEYALNSNNRDLINSNMEEILEGV